ncbi:MAG: thiamine-phosphate kinase [Gemmataceae bacterium]
MGERAFLDWLRQQTTGRDRVLLGLGDDAAAVAWGAGPPCLVTTDMLLEGSCFTLVGRPIQVPGVEPATPRRVGRKAMSVNLSDLAAMAAVPVAAVVSVGLPRDGGRALAQELYLGLKDQAEAFGVALVGGDTNSWDGPVTLSVTLFGEPGPGGIIRRSGAKLGDWLLVTGPLGGSIHGKHLDFTPRIHEALELVKKTHVNAMIDLSDGLAIDLARLCSESGCGAVLWAEALPISQAVTSRAASRTPQDHALHQGRSPLDHALNDGEDFELLLAVDAAEARRLIREQPIAGITLSAIGEVVSSGLWLQQQGQRVALPRGGHEHRLD